MKKYVCLRIKTKNKPEQEVLLEDILGSSNQMTLQDLSLFFIGYTSQLFPTNIDSLKEMDKIFELLLLFKFKFSPKIKNGEKLSINC